MENDEVIVLFKKILKNVEFSRVMLRNCLHQMFIQNLSDVSMHTQLEVISKISRTPCFVHVYFNLDLKTSLLRNIIVY